MEDVEGLSRKSLTDGIISYFFIYRSGETDVWFYKIYQEVDRSFIVKKKHCFIEGMEAMGVTCFIKNETVYKYDIQKGCLYELFNVDLLVDEDNKSLMSMTNVIATLDVRQTDMQQVINVRGKSIPIMFFKEHKMYYVTSDNYFSIIDFKDLTNLKYEAGEFIQTSSIDLERCQTTIPSYYANGHLFAIDNKDVRDELPCLYDFDLKTKEIRNIFTLPPAICSFKDYSTDSKLILFSNLRSREEPENTTTSTNIIEELQVYTDWY